MRKSKNRVGTSCASRRQLGSMPMRAVQRVKRASPSDGGLPVHPGGLGSWTPLDKRESMPSARAPRHESNHWQNSCWQSDRWEWEVGALESPGYDRRGCVESSTRGRAPIPAISALFRVPQQQNDGWLRPVKRTAVFWQPQANIARTVTPGLVAPSRRRTIWPRQSTRQPSRTGALLWQHLPPCQVAVARGPGDLQGRHHHGC
jgi:hypothetical protein